MRHINTLIICLLAVFSIGSIGHACSSAPYPAVSISPGTSVSAGRTIIFDGSLSDDHIDGGTVEKWQWTFPTGAVSITGTDSKIASCKFNAAGSYTVTMKIWDNEDLWSTYPVYITVTGTNDTWYVSPDGDDMDTGTSLGDAFASIKVALDCADDGHTIIIDEGVYYENIDFNGRDITIQSLVPTAPKLVENTIVKGLRQGPVVTFNGTESSDCKLNGIKISGCNREDDLIAYWDFENDAVESQNDFTTTEYNGPEYTEESLVDSYALHLDSDGTNDLMNCLEVSGFKGIGNTSARTCSVFIKPLSGTAFPIVSWGDDNIYAYGERWEFGLHYDSSVGTFLNLDVNGGYIRGTTKISQDMWHHVAVVMPEGTCSTDDVLLYLDGVLEETTSSTQMICTSLKDNMLIGANSSSESAYYQNGYMDELKIYSRALSADEISEIAYGQGLDEVAVWDFENNLDDDNSDLDGTASGGPIYDDTNNKINLYSLELDGTDDYVYINSDYRGVLGDQTRTCTAWIKTSDTNGPILWWGDNSEIGGEWLFEVKDRNSDGDAQVGVSTNGAYAYGSTIINTDSWVHVAVVMRSNDPCEMELYINGILESSITTQSGTIDTQRSLDYIRIGSGNNSEFFDGLMDDVRIYNRALDQWEIAVIAENERALYWDLDDNTGVTTYDSSGNGNDGTINGSASWSNNGGNTGDTGDHCLIFDGTDDYIVTPANVVDTSKPFSMFAWVYPDNYTATRDIFQQIDDGSKSGRTLLMMGYSGAVLQTSYAGQSFAVKAALEMGEWSHVGVVYDEERNFKIYLNGVFVGSQVRNPEYSSLKSAIRVGSHKSSTSNMWDGKMDDVVMYNCALPLSDIQALAGVSNEYSHWKFDETSGSSASDSGGGDTSFNASLTNFPTDGSQWVEGRLENCLEFDGSNDCVDVTGYKGILGTASRTVSAWIYIDETRVSADGFEMIMEWGCVDNTDGEFWLFCARDIDYTSGVEFVANLMVGGGGVIGSIEIPQGQWVHVAAVMEDKGSGTTTDDIDLYVNGKLDSEATHNTQSVNTISDNTLTIGHRVAVATSGWTFDGKIDDVRIYDTALTDKEIRGLFNGDCGIYGNGTSAAISNCIISDNETNYYGGGIWDVDGDISYCKIVNNTAVLNGGGIEGCDGTITHCVIANNSAANGGGLDNCSATIDNSTIANNSATTSGNEVNDCTGNITNCIVWNSTASVDPITNYSTGAISYCYMPDTWLGSGSNVITRPVTLTPDFEDTSTYDYHLKTTSVCIDLGNPHDEYIEEPPTNGSRINLGAYGNTWHAAQTVDSDGDKLPDGWEILYGLDPDDDNSDGIGNTDDEENTDGDNLTNYEEYLCGTSPTSSDTDGDSIADHLDDDEFNGVDYTGDGLTNAEELEHGLDPWRNNRGESWTQFVYDLEDNVTKQLTYQVKLDGTDWIVECTTENQTEYDDLGRVKYTRQLIDPGTEDGSSEGIDNALDNISVSLYDKSGNVTKSFTKGPGTTFVPGSYSSIAMTGEVVNDILTEYSYNLKGMLYRVENPLGMATEYLYDEFNRVTTENTVDTTGQSEVTTLKKTTEYDGIGRAYKTEDIQGNYNELSFNSRGQAIKQIRYDSSDTALQQQRMSYDSIGQLIRQATLATPSSNDAYTPVTSTDKIVDYVYNYNSTRERLTIIYDGTNAITSRSITSSEDNSGRGMPTEITSGLGTNQPKTVEKRYYDKAGRVTKRQTLNYDELAALQQTLTYLMDYDEFGRMTKSTADGTTDLETEYTYNGMGRQLTVTNPKGYVTSQSYNKFGLVSEKVEDSGTGGLARTTEYIYDRMGRLVTLIANDGTNDQTTFYAYNKSSAVTDITYPDSGVLSYEYGPIGTVIKRTDQKNVDTIYEYDDLGRLTAKYKDVTSPIKEIYAYDSLGRMTLAKKGDNATFDNISKDTLTYNNLGYLTSSVQSVLGGATKTVTYERNLLGQAESITYPDGSSTEYEFSYTSLGKINQISKSANVLVDYDYYGSTVETRTYGTTSAVTFTAGFDSFGRITTHNTVNGSGAGVQFAYSYDDNSNIVSKQFNHRTSDPSNIYSYDRLDRVTDSDYHNSEYEDFAYDLLGNRTTVKPRNSANSVAYLHNAVNQYTDIGGSTPDPEYDDNGNLTRDHRDYEYQYDVDNRLQVVYNDVNADGDYDSPGDTLYAEYQYDAMGRRIYSSIDSAARQYYYDGQRVIVETDGSGTFQQRYVFGNYIDEVLIIDDGTDDYYYGHDHLYSVVALFDDTGSVVERYEYDAYGAVQVMDASYTNRTTSSYDNPYTFTGRRLDELTSNLDIMYYRARYYDPEVGRFMQTDPLEFIDGMNLYEYVGSMPVMFVDPFGLAKKPDIKWIEWVVKENCLSPKGRDLLHDTITGRGLSKEAIKKEAAAIRALKGSYILPCVLCGLLAIDAVATDACAATLPPWRMRDLDNNDNATCVCVNTKKTQTYIIRKIPRIVFGIQFGSKLEWRPKGLVKEETSTIDFGSVGGCGCKNIEDTLNDATVADINSKGDPVFKPPGVVAIRVWPGKTKDIVTSNQWECSASSYVPEGQGE